MDLGEEMSKISKIYDISNYLFGIGKRRGKTKKEIESKNWKYVRWGGNRKADIANNKLTRHTDSIKKLTQKEKLKRLKQTKNN